MEERYIASVDLGTSKIAVAVARIEGDNVQMIYYRETPSEGVSESRVLNPAKVAVQLRKALDMAEKELGMKILQAVAGLPRWAVRQEIATATLERTNGDECIGEDELEALKTNAMSTYPLADESNEVIYGIVAQSFSVEDIHQTSEEGVIGMVSPTIDGNFKAFVGPKRAMTNLDMVFNKAGVAIADKVFTPAAVAKAVLSNDEMDNGVALIELGAGATSVTVYHGGIIRHYAAIPFGGNTITEDIKQESSISTRLAENIKLAYGACMPEKLASLEDKTIRINYTENMMEKQIPVKYLAEIITEREREIIEAMLYEIEASGYADYLRSGIVITGGGANLANCGNFIKVLSGYTVREGFPLNRFSSDGCLGVHETEAATSVGLILAAKENRTLNCTEDAPVAAKAAEIENQVETVPEEPEIQGKTETETSLQEGQLFGKEEFGPEVKPEKEKRKREKPKKPKGAFGLTWAKVKEKINDQMDNLYEGMENE